MSSGQRSSKVERLHRIRVHTRDAECKQMVEGSIPSAGSNINLGFCPRCMASFAEIRGRAVGGVRFCVFCAVRVEVVPAVLEGYVVWAKKYAEGSN